MIRTIEVTEAIETHKFITDLVGDGFYITINRMGVELQTETFVLTAEKRVKEYEFIEDTFVSSTLYGAVLQAWQRYMV